MGIAHLWFDFDFTRVDPLSAFSTFWDCFCQGFIVPECVEFLSLDADAFPKMAWPGSLPSAPFHPSLFAGERRLEGTNLTKWKDASERVPLLGQKDQIVQAWHEWWEHSNAHKEVNVECWGLTHLFFSRGENVCEDSFLMQELDFLDGITRVPVLCATLRFNVLSRNDLTLELTSYARVWSEWCLVPVGDEAWGKKSGLESAVAKRNVSVLADTIHRFVQTMSYGEFSWHEERESKRPDIAALLRAELTRVFGPSDQKTARA